MTIFYLEVENRLWGQKEIKPFNASIAYCNTFGFRQLRGVVEALKGLIGFSWLLSRV